MIPHGSLRSEITPDSCSRAVPPNFSERVLMAFPWGGNLWIKPECLPQLPTFTNLQPPTATKMQKFWLQPWHQHGSGVFQLNLCCFVLGLWRFAAVVYEKSSGSKMHLKDDIAKASIKESHGMSQCDEHQSHSNSNHPINPIFVLYHIFHHYFHPWSSHSP